MVKAPDFPQGPLWHNESRRIPNPQEKQRGRKGEETASELQIHRQKLIQLGEALPDTGMAHIGEALQDSGPWPEDLRGSPLIIDTDIGGDADDAVAVAAAARCVPELALVTTTDETAGPHGSGERARFARHLLGTLGRPDVPVTAGADLGNTRYYCVDGLIPAAVPPQGTDVASAVRALDPQFFRDHCKEVVLSRAVADAAIQDLEVNRGARFPQIDSFRRAKGRVAEADIHGSYRHLTNYLRGAGIPVGRPDRAVTLVDSSLKGTVQELLAAAYPQSGFIGRYAFYAASPDDPHPGNKHGYAVHLRPEQTHQGKGLAFDVLPRDPGLTFAQGDALSIIEDTLHGPLDTPVRLTGDGPSQGGQRDDPDTSPVSTPLSFRSGSATRSCMRRSRPAGFWPCMTVRSTSPGNETEVRTGRVISTGLARPRPSRAGRGSSTTEEQSTLF